MRSNSIAYRDVLWEAAVGILLEVVLGKEGRKEGRKSFRRITPCSKVEWTSQQKDNEGNELGTKHISHAVFLEILSVDNWMEYYIWKIEDCHVLVVAQLLQVSYI